MLDYEKCVEPLNPAFFSYICPSPACALLWSKWNCLPLLWNTWDEGRECWRLIKGFNTAAFKKKERKMGGNRANDATWDIKPLGKVQFWFVVCRCCFAWGFLLLFFSYKDDMRVLDPSFYCNYSIVFVLWRGPVGSANSLLGDWH